MGSFAAAVEAVGTVDFVGFAELAAVAELERYCHNTSPRMVDLAATVQMDSDTNFGVS